MVDNIISCARELGISIQESTEFKRLQAAREVQESDDALQERIQEFNLLRQKHLNEKNKPEEDQDSEKISSLEIQIQDMYGEIVMIPAMKEYLDAKQKMDKIMGEVNSILNYYIVGEEGCDSESCESCSGCGGHNHV